MFIEIYVQIRASSDPSFAKCHMWQVTKVKINFSLFWPILFCLMCLMLIIIPLVTETRDTLIGCGLLILGFIPYVLWVNQKYTPAPICAFANAIERGIGKFISLLHFKNYKTSFSSQNYKRFTIIVASYSRWTARRINLSVFIY